MTVNKDYCMSSYLTFRYVYDKNICFKDGILYRDHELIVDDRKTPCKTAEEIDDNIRKILSEIKLDHVAVLLSGDMDSAILASYMPAGTKAYTARCIGKKAVDETEQAKKYCNIYGLEHAVVDIIWDDYVTTMDELMLCDGSPIIPNGPQAYKLEKIAKQDGVTCILYGDCADIKSIDPYERLKMKEPLDLTRVRNGESKYLIRDWFRMRYPSLDVPEKLPISRPADDWMKDWTEPVRTEFILSCVKELNGEQKLLVYSLERFLDLIEA